MILSAPEHLVDAETCNWIDCAMETDANMADHMSTDEMYMVLQADMSRIKADNQALQSEIGDVRYKFVHLLQSCGLENEFPVDDLKMSTPQRSSRTTDGTPRRTNYNYADFLIEQLLAGTNNLTDSDLSISPDDTRNSAEVEPENLNNVDTCNPLSAGTNATNTYFQTDNHHVTVVSNVLTEVNNCRVMPNNIDVTTSENGVATSSDSYPQSSSDSSDNQVVPDLDLEKELVSRVQYYSDFTIDRQRKINQLLHQLKQNNSSSSILTQRPEVFPGGDSSERLVEGAEQRVSFQKPAPIRRSSRTPSCGTDSSSDPSTARRSSRSSRHGSNKTSSSRTSSHPLMSSTMISDPSNCMPSSSNSSVYTWSIDENSDPADLQGSYLRSRHSRSHRMHKSRKSLRTSRTSTERRRSHKHRQEAPSLHLTHMVSSIETSSCSRRVFADNTNFDDRTLPRTSTKASLPIINDSSWEKNPVHSTSGAEFVSIQPSDVSDTLDSSPLQERLDLPGKSSSSGSSASAIPHNTRASAMTETVTDCTNVSPLNGSSLQDTVFTDSPADSVNSSGIFAPCNSPRYSSVGSHCGYTTVSSSVPSSSSTDYHVPAPTPAMVKPSDPIFKIPHSPIGKKRSSKKSASESPSVRTSTPRPPFSGGSTRSGPVMRRKLFSPNTEGGQHRILDKKALVRKFKKFSHRFYNQEKSSKIRTLANL